MILSVIGHSYVGLVMAAVFADLGNTVWVIGRNRGKIEKLKKGIVPFYEPGLTELVKRNIKRGHLKFTLDYKQAIPPSEIVFIAVGTPSSDNGEADPSAVFEVSEKIASNLSGYTIIATKSTVPPGTNRRIKEIIERKKKLKVVFDVASIPEFLSQGTALQNTLHPDRIVIGTESQKARKILLRLHEPIAGQVLFTSLETAEMIKYAANAMLATKISFANTIALLCERVGADALQVLEGVGADKRVGRAFLNPGVGFGGSCLPKDVKALYKFGKKAGFTPKLLEAVYKMNQEVKEDFIKKVLKLLNNQVRDKTIGVWGLAFKPNTDDMREAPSIYIIRSLQKKGAKIRAYDPAAQENAEKIMTNITFCKDPYDVCKNSDILLVLTEWNEFKELDLLKVKGLLKNPIILDGRNVYDKKELEKLGFKYLGVGR